MLKATAVITGLLTASATAAVAQYEMPKTFNLTDKNGIFTGTATMWGNKTTYRDAKGELVGSTVIENNVVTYYTPDGKVVRSVVVTKGGTHLVHRNAEGVITGSATMEQNGDFTYRDANGNIINAPPD